MGLVRGLVAGVGFHYAKEGGEGTEVLIVGRIL